MANRDISTGDLMNKLSGISAAFLAMIAIYSLVSAQGAQSKQVAVNEKNISNLSAADKDKEKRLTKLEAKVGNIDTNVNHIRKVIDEMRKENAKKKK